MRHVLAFDRRLGVASLLVLVGACDRGGASSASPQTPVLPEKAPPSVEATSRAEPRRGAAAASRPTTTTAPAPMAPVAPAATPGEPELAAPWSMDLPPPIPANATRETRDEAHGRRVTIARSQDGREVWVVYPRPGGRPSLVGYTRYTGELPSDPTRWRIVPTFDLDGETGGDEGSSFVAITTDGLAVETDGAQSTLRLELAPGQTDRAAALAATFRARRIYTQRSNRVVIGPPEALFAMPAPGPRRSGWRMEILRPQRPSPASPPQGEDMGEDLRGTGGAEDVALRMFSLGGDAWEAWLVRGDRSVFLFGSRTEAMSGPQAVTYDEGGQRMYFIWMWEPDSVRFFATRIDATTLERVGEVLAVQAHAIGEVECGNVFSGTFPLMVLAADGSVLYAQAFDGTSYGSLFPRADHGDARRISIHHDAAFYDRNREGSAGEQGPPLVRLRGAADDPAAYLDPIPAT